MYKYICRISVVPSAAHAAARNIIPTAMQSIQKTKLHDTVRNFNSYLGSILSASPQMQPHGGNDLTPHVSSCMGYALYSVLWGMY